MSGRGSLPGGTVMAVVFLLLNLGVIADQSRLRALFDNGSTTQEEMPADADSTSPST